MNSEWLLLSLILCVFIDNSRPVVALGELVLTPFIKENRIQDARNASAVDPALFLGVRSHSGFFTVEEKYNSNLFFWYFPVPNKPLNETPWIIWLQGGPGATSLYGLFDEIGPFQYVNNSLKLRQWTWGSEYSLLFIDNPVGTGYSFTDDDRGYANDMATYANHLYIAVDQFVTIFPELGAAPLYIAGESYGGRFVPALANEIYKRNSSGKINLQGLILGNPVLERESVVDLSAMFYHWGLIDAQGLAEGKARQDAYTAAVKENNNEKAREKWNELLDYLQDLAALQQLYNILLDKQNLTGFLKFLSEDVERAIHVRNGSAKPHGMTFSSIAVKDHLVNDFLVHTTPMVQTLLEHYRLLIYCGQMDLMAPCVPNSLARRKVWSWKYKATFMNAPRVPWFDNGTVAGYVKSGGGLTEVLVRGAGHMSPVDKPAATFKMVRNFISQVPFPIPKDYKLVYPSTDLDEGDSYSPISAGAVMLIVSLVLNVAMAAGICAYILRRRIKQRTEDEWLYSAVDDRIHNNVLEIA